jgi:hypothetical protein
MFDLVVSAAIQFNDLRDPDQLLLLQGLERY